jgi:hypothetical protein
MRYLIFFCCLYSISLSGQGRFSGQELSINFFRNPSIGLEYRYRAVSVHAGWYLTALEPNLTWKFAKAGLTYWLLPFGKKAHPSSFYVQASYLRGLNRNYQGLNCGMLDLGCRLMIWKGLQLRLGAAALFVPGRALKINPTPSLNYSFFF